jgi:hypothetical protein
MVASVLNTRCAVEMSVFVVRAFVTLRQAVAQHKELASRLAELKRRLGDHDSKIRSLIEAVKQLMAPREVPEKRRIGFRKEGP